jgi:hypothetical protein
MRSLAVRVIGGLLLATLLTASAIQASEPAEDIDRQGKSISTDQIPDAVAKLLQMEVGGDKILGITQTMTDGAESYVVEWTAAGAAIQTTYSVEGIVLSRQVEFPRQKTLAPGDDDEDEDSDNEDSEDEDSETEEEFEREITIDLVPEPAKSKILNEAGEHKIQEVELVVVDGQLLYEADWYVDDYEVGIAVTPGGGIVLREREKLNTSE